MNLYYLHYNNYYNRIIKKFDNLSDYIQSPYYDNVATLNVAFNPNDGVNTEQIVNIPSREKTFTYDYAILAEGNEIISRWFILDAKRLRNGQYKINLKRDLFADSLESILDAPAFIEKATLNDNDPLIFNKEDMTYNQIKKSETLLKDETGCAWIVGYLARNDASGNRKDYNVSFNINTPIDISVNNINEWDYYDYLLTGNNKPFSSNWNISYGLSYKNENSVTGKIYRFNKNGLINQGTSEYSYSNLIYPTDFFDNYTELANALDQVIGNNVDIKTDAQVVDFLNLNGQTIYDISQQKAYKIIVYNYNTSGTKYYIQRDYPQLYNVFNSFVPNGNDRAYSFSYDCIGYGVRLEEISSAENYTLSITDRYTLNNAPYDMFCIPYTDGFEIYKNGTLISNKSSKDIAFGTAMALSRIYSNESAKFLYDLQLLPYCPIRYAIKEDGSFDIEDNDLGLTYIKQNDENVCPVLFANTDSFTLNIMLENPIIINNTKVESECDMYRLCSPNYNGVFEFNAAKNGGISYFNVDCTYKPYDPYIHLNPNFSKLYGQDFNDSRGLVVGGDFSLPQTTSAWESYQLSNKNFLNSFNRQITNMEVNNSLQLLKSKTEMALGTIGGGIGGFLSGGILGGALGATASAIGGAMDLAILETSQKEAIDYTKDQFGYNLGNIQALPQGVAKTTALVYNNKIFPFLEYYTCTDEEKTALENKIRYNGMTVMRIGTISEFKKDIITYIKGKFIRLENLNEDYHYVNELANEFNKGVFI